MHRNIAGHIFQILKLNFTSHTVHLSYQMFLTVTNISSQYSQSLFPCMVDQLDPSFTHRYDSDGWERRVGGEGGLTYTGTYLRHNSTGWLKLIMQDFDDFNKNLFVYFS